MARSRLFLLVGLLVAGMAIPALAADPIKIQFAAQTNMFGNYYHGANSPAVATGDFKSSDNYWNPVQCNADIYLNLGFPNVDHPLKYADGTAGAYESGIRIGGAGNIGQAGHSGWEATFDDPAGSGAGYDYDAEIQSGFYANDLARSQIQAYQSNIGLRFNGLPAGKYRVYAIAIPAVLYGWGMTGPQFPDGAENVSIGVNLNAQLSASAIGAWIGGSGPGDAQSCGSINLNTDNSWVAGKNYVTKDVTLSGPSDYISVITWALNGVQIVQLPNLLGDADGNGKVDFQDYLALESSFGNTVTPGTGADFDSNGVVNFQDYLTLESNFGAGAVVEAPEPMTLSLLGLGGLALIRRRK